MRKLAFSLALYLTGLGIGFLVLAPEARASCEPGGFRITVYFDRAGTIRVMDSPGSGTAVVYIIGEEFTEIPPFVSGAQYKIDYGPHITWIADQQLPPASIGSSASGISIGFGPNPRRGTKFLIHSALIEWNSDCVAARNSSFPVVVKHPHFPDQVPIVTRFPDNEIFGANGRRSQLCQLVELDILPGECPNFFPTKAWESGNRGKSQKSGLLQVAVLGSSTVNVNDIDKGSVLLQGIAPIPWPQTTWFDVGKADGDNDCECPVPHPHGDGDRRRSSGSSDRGRGDDDDDDQPQGKDRRKDLVLYFSRADIAAAISPTAPAPGTEVTLTLAACYKDGLPFKATDCIVIKGHGRDDDDDGDGGSGNSDILAGGDTPRLGHPYPNPFNPVTRIGYNVPSTQHVRIAIYDVAGRLVENLVDEVKAPGEYVVEWDAGNLPSGVYFYRMQTGSETIVRRATLLK